MKERNGKVVSSTLPESEPLFTVEVGVGRLNYCRRSYRPLSPLQEAKEEEHKGKAKSEWGSGGASGS